MGFKQSTQSKKNINSSRNQITVSKERGNTPVSGRSNQKPDLTMWRQLHTNLRSLEFHYQQQGGYRWMPIRVVNISFWL